MIYLGNSEKRLKANITTRINDLIEKLNSPNISRETILEMIQCSKELQQFGINTKLRLALFIDKNVNEDEPFFSLKIVLFDKYASWYNLVINYDQNIIDTYLRWYYDSIGKEYCSQTPDGEFDIPLVVYNSATHYDRENQLLMLDISLDDCPKYKFNKAPKEKSMIINRSIFNPAESLL